MSCYDSNIMCVLSTILRRSLIVSGEIIRMLKFLEQVPISGIRLIPPLSAGKWLTKEDVMLTNEEKLKGQKILSSSTIPIIGKGLRNRICGATTGYCIYISAKGNIQPCGYIPYYFGNVLQDDIALAIKAMSNHKMLNRNTPCCMEDSIFRSEYISNIYKKDIELPIKVEKLDD